MSNPVEIPFQQLLDALLDVDTPLPPRYLYRLSDLDKVELALLKDTWPSIPAWRRQALMEDVETLGESDTLLSFFDLAQFALKDDEAKTADEEIANDKDAAEMEKAFEAWPGAVATTLEVPERCNVEIELGRRLLPRFPAPDGEEAGSRLRRLVDGGLRRRYGDPIPAGARERTDFELGVTPNAGAPKDLRKKSRSFTISALSTGLNLGFVQAGGFATKAGVRARRLVAAR